MIRAGGTAHADPSATSLAETATADGIRLVHPAGGEVSPGAAQSATGGQPCPDDQPGPVSSAGHSRPLRSWPLLILALPATVAVWSGWVGIGQLTGFGEVQPLPGIWDSLHLDTAVTLPVGVEAYAAYALRAWLSPAAASARTRRFARWSAIGSLTLGMAGQVAYHLLTQAHATRAPWAITTAVACLPVLVLGMGAALTHLIHADTSHSSWPGQASPPGPGAATTEAGDDLTNVDGARQAVPPDQLVRAQAIAARLTAAGQRVSRRSLRAAGLHGSNANLSTMAMAIRDCQPAREASDRLTTSG